MANQFNRSIRIIALIAGAFGLLTVISGGTVLFFTSRFREEVGNFVPFVVWFNFLVGFAYVIAGGGLWYLKKWAVWLSLFIAITTLVIFLVLGIHILQGGLFEVRTVAAMIFRFVVWALIAIFSYRQIVH